VQSGSHDEIEKLALFNFVMAAQASDFGFSFYNALDISKRHGFFKLSL